MQKIACREFAEKNNWVIAKEFLEKGISGFKVSASKRDAIQDLIRHFAISQKSCDIKIFP